MSDNSVNNINNTIERYPPELQCMICFEELDVRFENRNDTCETDCLHTYHSTCLIEWFKHGHTHCPMCNTRDISIINDLFHIEFRTEAQYTQLVRERAANIALKDNNKGSVPDLVYSDDEDDGDQHMPEIVYVGSHQENTIDDNDFIENLSIEDLRAEIFISIQGPSEPYQDPQLLINHINYHMRLEERLEVLEEMERETDYMFSMSMGIRAEDYHFPHERIQRLTYTQLERLFS